MVENTTHFIDIYTNILKTSTHRLDLSFFEQKKKKTYVQFSTQSAASFSDYGPRDELPKSIWRGNCGPALILGSSHHGPGRVGKRDETDCDTGERVGPRADGVPQGGSQRARRIRGDY